MDEVLKLEHLSLVSRICTELDNHLGINDKDLAEFIIDLAEKNTDFNSFKKVLTENGAEFPDSFVSNLLRVIQLMKTSKSAAGKGFDAVDDKKGQLVTKFPGLAMPNQTPADMHADDRKDEKDKKMVKTVADDMMDELEALAPKSAAGGECSTSAEQREHSRDRKRQSVSRERKPDKHRMRSRSRSRDRKRSHSRERRRRSRSRDGDKHHRDGDRHHRDRDSDRHHRDRDRSKERHRDDRHHDDRHRDSRRRRSR